MLEHENASIDFDILLLEDDGEQRVEPDPGLELLSEAVTVKQEHDDELEWEGEDTMPDIGTRQHAIDCIEEWTLENLMEMSSDKPVSIFVEHKRKP
ncbi:hypothetical protein FRC12_007040 [Ceratobasidium sp. 428]|nr:hypothetical protein FRC12_007040 [Ceratobasidium sp. 428]